MDDQLLGFPQQPMISNGRLFLRGEEVLVCYQVGEYRQGSDH